MIPSVIERWLIAGAVEHGRALPGWLRRRVEGSPELRRYMAALGTIESALGAGGARMVPSPGLSLKIADSLSHRGVLSRRSAPLGWVGGALALAGFVMVLVVVAKLVPTKVEPPRRPVALGQAFPPELRHRPIVSIGPPLNERWQALTVGTRRSVSGFIRGLPGLPVGDPDQTRLN